MRKMIFFAVLVGMTTSLYSAGPKSEKARLARELSDYTDLLSFKDREDIIFVIEDDGLVLKYGMFEDDDNPQDSSAWNSFDVLYEDVPVLYESALSLMAKGDWKQTLELLDRCASEKTSISKSKFSDSNIFKNYVPHKKFLCYLGLGQEEKAIEVSNDIMANAKAHSRVRVMLAVLPLFIKQENGSKALSIADELLKLRLPRKDLVDVRIHHCLALSLTKDYANAKKGLSVLVDEFGADYAGLGDRVADAETTILVYHEKNYSKAIRFFEDLLSKDRTKATADVYSKLAFCYGKKDKWEDSRWNYLQAYLVGSFSDVELKELISKIEMTNSKINSENGNVALESFFGKVKKAL